MGSGAGTGPESAKLGHIVWRRLLTTRHPRPLIYLMISNSISKFVVRE